MNLKNIRQKEDEICWKNRPSIQNQLKKLWNFF